MEKAREAFAADEALLDVQIVELASLPYMLEARAPLKHDWTKSATSAAQRNWWFHHYRADDLSANVRQLLGAEQALASPERHAAWKVIAEQDPRASAERLVLRHLEQMVAVRNEVWDPRLEIVAEAVVTLGQLWKELAPELAAPPPATTSPLASGPSSGLAERVRMALATADLSPISPELEKARQLLRDQNDRDLTTRFYLLRLREAASATGPHAERIARATTATTRKEQYAQLAGRCAELVAAIDLLCKK